MSGRRVLHLVRGTEPPDELREAPPEDRVVLLGADEPDEEELVRLLFEYDLVMTW